MSKYARIQVIKERLEGKVKFADPGVPDPNKLGQPLLGILVSEAEAQLEIDLMMRYDVPFRAVSDVFEKLPDVTKHMIQMLAEVNSVIQILQTDFGRGTSANAEKYTEQLQKRYDAKIKQLMDLKDKSYQTWLLPPLPGLALAYNNQGDTGFRGRVFNTTTISHEADYAYKQINSPGENLFSGILDPVDFGNTGHTP